MKPVQGQFDSVASHANTLAALGCASRSETPGEKSEWPNSLGRLTPETHVNVTSSSYHKKWTPEDSKHGVKNDNNSFEVGDFDDHAFDEKGHK